MRVTNSVPSAIRRSCTEPTFSSSPIGIRSCRIILPVSISCFSMNVVAPVSLSPFITARLIGAAPRYCGSSEAWRLNVPSRGIDHTTSGSIRKATTICRSALYDRSSSRKTSSFSFSGCSIGKPTERAYFLTSEYCTWCPRPAGLSGMVTTATTLYPPSTRACRLAAANSGVPKYTILKSFFVITSKPLTFNPSLDISVREKPAVCPLPGSAAACTRV